MELVFPKLNTPGRPSRIFVARHRSIARRDRPHRGHTQPLSDATCSRASSKSCSVKSVVKLSSEEKGGTTDASDVSVAFLSFAGKPARVEATRVKIEAHGRYS